MPEPVERLTFETARLMASCPPVWRDPNKLAVYRIACPPGTRHEGKIVYSRWPAFGLPEALDAAGARRLVEGREDVYDYAPTPGVEGGMEWHVNFADPHLFAAYGSGLLAQDEMQVAEHPALGALREALQAMGRTPRTVEAARPTPVLVAGVARRCRIATDPNAAEGRPQGLYGNAFARAPEAVVRQAATPIEPPTLSNIIAMAAPSGGRGRYSRGQVEYVLEAAFTGYRAAVLESGRLRGAGTPVVVHTGFWGCGAFGGNRLLMAMLQALAAGAAGLERLVFHTYDAAGTRVLAGALDTLGELAGDGAPRSTGRVIDEVVAIGFEWGVSDGN